MSVETQVLALFEKGNPVPELDGLERIDPDAAAYLATLIQGSSEVTQIETEKVEEQEEKRPMMPWLIAAVLAVVVGVALLVINHDAKDAPVASDNGG